MKKFLLMSAIISSGYLLGMEDDSEVVELSKILSKSSTVYKKADTLVKVIESNPQALKMIEQADAVLNMGYGTKLNTIRCAFKNSTLDNSKNDDNISEEEEENFLAVLEILQCHIDGVIGFGR